MKTLFKNAVVLNHDASVSSPTDILVEGDIIAKIADNITKPGAEIIDCTGRYLSPGLTILHAHSPMHILQGIAEDMTIEGWFNDGIWAYESKITDDDLYWGARLAYAEMINNGVCAFADHYFSPEIIIKATKEAGLKVDLAPTAFGLDTDSDIADTLALIEKYKDDKDISVRFGPHSPYLINPTELTKIVSAAKKAGVGIHIHASETELQEKQSIEKYGKRHFQLISEAGGFDVPCIIAHGLWADNNDLALTSGDTVIAACAKTYLKLGMGKGHLWANWKKKNLAIGTDGSASSNSLRPVEQAMMFALAGKWAESSDDLAVEDIWRILLNGHNFLNFNSGRVAEGMSADLLVWNLNTPETVPVYNPFTAIIYSSTASNITHNMVAGKLLKKDGQLTTDTTEIVNSAVSCANALYKRGKGELKVEF